MRFSIFFLASFALLVACNSLHRQANHFMEEGSYWDAVQTYGRILAEKPGDPEALTGLKKARQKYIESELLKIRNSRMGNQVAASVENLEFVLERENEWKEFPGGAVGFTQEDEISEAKKNLVRLVEETVKANRPLKGEYWIRKASLIFAKINSATQKDMAKRVHDLGGNLCQSLKTSQSSGTAFYNDFSAHVCTYFGKKTPETQVAKTLWSQIQTDIKSQSLPVSSRSQIQQALLNGFQKSPWYESTSSRTLRIPLEGEFHSDTTQYPVQLSHQYTVSVPYTAFESKRKERQVLRERLGEYRYETEAYYENEPVTKYRDEIRVHSFLGTEYRMGVSFNLSGGFQELGIPISLSFAKEESFSDTTHNVSLPSIHLFPDPLNLMSKEKWFSNQMAEVQAQFSQQLTSQWEQKYCTVGSGVLENQSQEKALRCLKLKQLTAPEWIRNWSVAQFGTDLAQLNYVLDLY